MWFPVRGQATQPAKAICVGCPVRVDCLAAALVDPVTHGIWGGLSARERRTVRMHTAA